MQKKYYIAGIALVLAIILIALGIRKFSQIRENNRIFEMVRNIDYVTMEPQVAEKIARLLQEAQKHPGSAEKWGLLGMNLYIHNNKQQAVPVFEKAAALDKHDFRWSYFCAIALNELASEDPVVWFARSESIRPDYPPLIVRYANRCLLTGDIEKAGQLFQRVVSSPIKVPHVHLGLAKIAIQKSELAEAQQQLQLALQMVPNYREAHAMLADVYRRQGNKERAEEEFRIMKTLPDRLDLADPVYQEMEKEGVSSFWCQVRANNFLENGQLAEAEAELLKAVEAKPNVVSYTSLGYVYQRQQRYDQAIDHYQTALRLDSTYVSAINNLGVIYFETGRMEEAVKLLQRSLTLSPESVDGYLNLGTFLRQQGRRGEAIQYFRQGRELAPDDLRFAYQLAWLLAVSPEAKLRNGNEAEQLAELVCEESNYKNPAALDLLAAAQAENKNFKQAAETAGRGYVLAILQKKNQLAGEIESRQKLYQTGKPYREK